jgi:pimeloyl-ACP methyl ester carboxylesterase
MALIWAETFKGIRCPVVILWGERDPLMVPHHALAAARALADAGNTRVAAHLPGYHAQLYARS